MSASQPLHGTDLISCARASLSLGIAEATQQCGYDQNVAEFQNSLKQACQQIGINLTEMGQLLEEPDRPEAGIEISPDSPTSL